MYLETDHRYWLQVIEEKTIDYVEEMPTDSHSSIGEARARAINIYYRKQSVKQNDENLRIGKNTRTAAWIAALAAFLTLLITIKQCSG